MILFLLWGCSKTFFGIIPDGRTEWMDWTDGLDGQTGCSDWTGTDGMDWTDGLDGWT